VKAESRSPEAGSRKPEAGKTGSREDRKQKEGQPGAPETVLEPSRLEGPRENEVTCGMLPVDCETMKI
jgi:hypothetical protein